MLRSTSNHWCTIRLMPIAYIGVMGFLATFAPVFASDWTEIRPQATSEAEILSKFGPPDEVVASFPWQEWNAKWKKHPQALSYLFRYHVGSSVSNLLVGPGGKAENAEVEISAGKVVGVRWLYGGESAQAAAKAIRADGTMTVSDDEGTVRSASKPVPGGWILAELGARDTTVTISLMLK